MLTRSAGEAAEFIRNGGIVAFPTETVYGLGANVFDGAAVEKIFAAKERPADNPLIAHISDLSQVRELASSISSDAEKLIHRFFPGPLTLVLPKSRKVPMIATAGLDTIGVRMPRHELAREFLSACGVPVVAPSANLSGRPSPTTWQAVLEDLDGRIDCVLQGEATEIGLESTVVDCSGEVPVLLRQGAITIEDLRRTVPETVVYSQRNSPDVVRSPGLKHRHYSPTAKVVTIGSVETARPHPRAAYIGLDRRADDDSFDLSLSCDSIDEYAHSMFEFFRECDRRNIHTIYCQEVPEVGIGAALMDRLRRAAKG